MRSGVWAIGDLSVAPEDGGAVVDTTNLRMMVSNATGTLKRKERAYSASSPVTSEISADLREGLGLGVVVETASLATRALRWSSAGGLQTKQMSLRVVQLTI